MVIGCLGEGGRYGLALIRRTTRARNTDALHYGCAYVAETLPSIPGETFWLCIFVEHRSLEVAFTALSLSFGALKLSQI